MELRGELQTSPMLSGADFKGIRRSLFSNATLIVLWNEVTRHEGCRSHGEERGRFDSDRDDRGTVLRWWGTPAHAAIPSTSRKSKSGSWDRRPPMSVVSSKVGPGT